MLYKTEWQTKFQGFQLFMLSVSSMRSKAEMESESPATIPSVL